MFSELGGHSLLLSQVLFVKLLLICVKGSIISALLLAYPEYEWKPWLFKNPPKKICKDKQTEAQFMEWLGDQLGYKVTNGFILR